MNTTSPQIREAASVGTCPPQRPSDQVEMRDSGISRTCRCRSGNTSKRLQARSPVTVCAKRTQRTRAQGAPS